MKLTLMYTVNDGTVKVTEPVDVADGDSVQFSDECGLVLVAYAGEPDKGRLVDDRRTLERRLRRLTR